MAQLLAGRKESVWIDLDFKQDEVVVMRWKVSPTKDKSEYTQARFANAHIDIESEAFES